MKKRDDVLVGIVMAVAIIVAILGSLWLARGGLSKGYALYAKFPWSSGLKQGRQPGIFRSTIFVPYRSMAIIA